ncbi:MAG: alanine racemase [Clostridium sp.]|nr:alanine racemase [Clostridium sp.]MCM1398492.1 alanine racemase [Clostridium sp.]MCM1460214.1 alanine racemase [Bacteroides sp.]
MYESKLMEIAERYGTPSYVFFEETLIRRVDLIRTLLRNTELCFAMKANPFLAGALARLTDKLEVCSFGEYEICIREGIATDQLVVSGVSKTLEQMEEIMYFSQGKGTYTIESRQQYEVLKACAKKFDVRLKVLPRLSSGNQFGMDEESIMQLLSQIYEDDLMDVAGLHYYGGTQKKLEKVEKELKLLEDVAKRISKTYQLDGLELEYGPGLKVSYFENDSEAEKASADAELQLMGLARMLEKLDGYKKVTIELGRFLTADCGYFLTRIMDIKQTGNSGYMIVDGGIHQINYYGQLMGMKKPYMKLIGENAVKAVEQNNGGPCGYAVCGSLCTVNDVLVRDIKPDCPKIGEVLSFERCGAYAVTEGMALFLSRDLPQVLFVRADGTVDRLRHKTEINILNSNLVTFKE